VPATFDEGGRIGYDSGVTSTRATIAEEVERYLRTGEIDPYHAAWTGSFLERARRSHDDLRGGLVREVRRRAEGRPHRRLPPIDTVAFTRRKVEPMVRGLFPRAEQETVLAMLEKSVVFLTAENVESVLLGQMFDHSAWILANLYLASVGAELLGDRAPGVVGLSQATTCYVSVEYFGDEEDPFADFVTHEAAHTFHNCKRSRLGLVETRTREWLLDIAFAKREEFAYACEAYARILERAGSTADRRRLADQYAATIRIQDRDVDGSEVASIVQAAAAARNGWKVILARCSPSMRVSRLAGRV
jgi:hypothetical protein